MNQICGDFFKFLGKKATFACRLTVLGLRHLTSDKLGTSERSEGSLTNWNSLGTGDAFSHIAFLLNHIANVNPQLDHNMKRNEPSGQLSLPVKLAFFQAVLGQKMGSSPAARYFRETGLCMGQCSCRGHLMKK